MRFRLATIGYVFALLAAGMAAFGAWGILAACGVARLYASSSRLRFTARLLVLLLVVAAAGLLLEAIPSALNAAVRNDCLGNVKQIALAIANYESEKGHYPPAFIADECGKPMHSWRVLILPYLGYEDLYEQYRFDEPWDGPHNRRLWDQIPHAYRCKSYDWCRKLGEPYGEMPANAANYFAVVGEETAWPPAGVMSDAQVRRGDGTSQDAAFS